MSDQPREGRRRRWWFWSALIAVVLVVAVAVVAVVWAVRATPTTDRGDATPSAPGMETSSAPVVSPSASTDVSAAPEADGGTAPAAAEPQVELPAAAPDAEVTADLGLTVRLADIEHVDGESTTAGEIAGPAVRFTVAVTNEGSSAVDLAYSLVNAYIGEDRIPAVQLTQPGGRPLQGSLEPGSTATGVYLFVVPLDQRGDVTVVYDYAAGSPLVVFRGDVG